MVKLESIKTNPLLNIRRKSIFKLERNILLERSVIDEGYNYEEVE